MAGGMDLGQGHKGGKKPLDTSINLVPFIDLMACTISFLIITAVWTQIGRLQVSSSGADTTTPQDTKKTPPINLTLTPTNLALEVGPVQTLTEPIQRDSKGALKLEKLVDAIKTVRAKIPDEEAVTIQTNAEVHYADLVRVIDKCIGAGLPNVSITALSS